MLRTSLLLMAAASTCLFLGGCLRGRGKKPENMVEVVCAAADLESGTIIVKDLLTTKKIPKRYYSEQMVMAVELQVVAGNELVGSLKKGDLLLWPMLRGGKSGSASVAESVRKMGRGITITTSGGSAVGEVVRPGDHVDVVAVLKDPATKQMVAQTVTQNVVVLSVNGRHVDGADTPAKRTRRPGTVTLLVGPREGKHIALAHSVGRLYLMLRNQDDTGIVETPARVDPSGMISGEYGRELSRKRMRSLQRLKKIIRSVDKKEKKPR
jgi:Flp pilus assembly protein CpaB